VQERKRTPRLDCVIWDVGNVLIRWEMHNLYRRRGMTDADIQAFLAETELPRHNVGFDAGEPFASGCAALAERFPHYAGHLLAFDTQWVDALDGAIDASVTALGKLRAAGVPCHAITNFSRVKFDIARQMFPFLDGFDDIIVSADVRLVKPDAAIFQMLIERQRLDPARALFIDDSDKNIATAQRLGLQTHHFNERTSDLLAELTSFGLAV
jgi:2-haloacid dehalogenase